MKTPVPQFASGVRYSDVRAVQCCAPPRRRSHFARILEILAISNGANASASTGFARHDEPSLSLFLTLSQCTPYQCNFVEVPLDVLPPCSHGGPIEAISHHFGPRESGLRSRANRVSTAMLPNQLPVWMPADKRYLGKTGVWSAAPW